MTAVVGNLYDKHGSSHPVVRRLMGGFEAALGELLELAAPRTLLDAGCGEGVLTRRMARRLAPGRVVGVDLPGLEDEWARRAEPNLSYRVADAERLPFADGEFDAVTALEVLEHVGDAERAVAEMARVARGGHVVASVPREPLWRALNLARGAHLRSLGDTPGHVHHWSARGFTRLLERHGEVVGVRTPLPWTMLLLRV